MEKKFDAIVAGHICLDIIPEFDISAVKKISSLFVSGRLINMNKMVISTGGVVSNTGLNLKKLGLNVGLMGKIGNDSLGELIISLLKERDADKDMIISKGENTSYTIVLAPPGIDRMFLHNVGTNGTYSSEDIDYAEVENARLFHLGYPTVMKVLYSNNGEELINIYRKVKEYGVITSMDVTLPDPESEAGKVDWKEILKDLLSYVNVFMPNIEEAIFMLDKDRFFEIKKEAGNKDILDFYAIEDIELLADEFIEFGVKIICLKLGQGGSFCKTASKEKMNSLKGILSDNIDNWSDRILRGESCQVSNFGSATGAGDSFTAGFLAAFLREFTIEDALRIASCVGAQCVTGMDAISGVKDWVATLSLVETMKPNHIQLNKPWEYNKSKYVWYKK